MAFPWAYPAGGRGISLLFPPHRLARRGCTGASRRASGKRARRQYSRIPRPATNRPARSEGRANDRRVDDPVKRLVTARLAAAWWRSTPATHPPLPSPYVDSPDPAPRYLIFFYLSEVADPEPTRSAFHRSVVPKRGAAPTNRSRETHDPQPAYHPSAIVCLGSGRGSLSSPTVHRTVGLLTAAPDPAPWSPGPPDAVDPQARLPGRRARPSLAPRLSLRTWTSSAGTCPNFFYVTNYNPQRLENEFP